MSLGDAGDELRALGGEDERGVCVADVPAREEALDAFEPDVSFFFRPSLFVAGGGDRLPETGEELRPAEGERCLELLRLPAVELRTRSRPCRLAPIPQLKSKSIKEATAAKQGRLT